MSDSVKSHPAVIPPVIQYHKIDKPGHGTLVRGGFTPPRRFARQMAFLKQRGLVFYTASGLIEYFIEHDSFPENGIAVTSMMAGRIITRMHFRCCKSSD